MFCSMFICGICRGLVISFSLICDAPGIFFSFQKILKCLNVKMLVDLTHYVVPTGFIYLWFLIFTLYILPESSHQFSFMPGFSSPPFSLSLSLSLSRARARLHTHIKGHNMYKFY